MRHLPHEIRSGRGMGWMGTLPISGKSSRANVVCLIPKLRLPHELSEDDKT